MAINEISSTEIDRFLASPIVTWFVSCLDESVKDRISYEELVDGVLIYDVFLQMDIAGQTNDVSPSHNNAEQRLYNLETVMRHIRQFYEDYLDDIILYAPDCRVIAHEPEANIREVELLLVLLLGCAIKCRNNDHFIERMTLLDDKTQAVIVEYIRKVLHEPDIVLSKEMLVVDSTDAELISNHKQKVRQAFKEIQRINKEKQDLAEQLRRTTLRSNNNALSCEELNEWKSEAITLNDQLDDYKRKIVRLESENKRLASESQSYRDDLEDMSEKLQRTERLDKEVNSYKEKLKNMKSYEVRFDQLEQHNRSLRESKEELASQLNEYKAKTKRKMREMEMEIYRLHERCRELTFENEASCEQNSRLFEENADLERRMKLSSSLNVTLDSSLSAEADESFNSYYNNSSICEQLSQSVQSRSLKYELESRRLETLEENSFHESSMKNLDLENDKKSLENEELKVKVSKLEEQLTSANKETMQLRILLEKTHELNNQELVSKVAMLDLNKKNTEEIIEEMQRTMSEDEDEDSEDDLNSSILKSPTKHKVDYDQLYSDYQSVLRERNALERKLQMQLMSRTEVKSSDNLSQELKDLKQDFGLLMSEYQKEKLKSDELTKICKENRQELHAQNVKIIDFDIKYRKLRNKYEVLMELKNRIEDDNEMLKTYMAGIFEDNHKLVENIREKQLQFQEEEKKKDATLNNLSRAKAKLEDKVMDQYRHMNNSNISRRESKKRSAAVNAMRNTFVKVRRAGSEIFGGSRSSSVDNNDFRNNKTLDTKTKATGFTYIKKKKNKSIDFFENFSPDGFSFENNKEN